MTYENFVQVQLAAPLGSSDTSLALTNPKGAYRLPPTTGGILVLADSVGSPQFTEIVRYASRSGNTLSGLTRGQEGTSARAWPAGTFCYQSLTAGDFANALGLKAPLESPAFTGNPTAPTPAATGNDTSIATTAHVKAAIGLFGVGTASLGADIADPDAIAANGLYRTWNNAKMPSLGTWIILHIMREGASGRAVQIGWEDTTQTEWRRHRTSAGVWQSWYRVWDSKNLIKQTSSTDTTAEALMAVGAFGIGQHMDLRGTVFENGTPADVFGKGMVSGFARGGPDGLKIPVITSNSVFGVLSVYGHWVDGTGGAGSAWREFRTSGGRVYHQDQSYGAWGAWREVFNTGNLVKQTSPTDTTAGAMMAVGAFGVGGSLSLPDANWPPMGGGFYDHVFTENSNTHTGYPRLGDGYPRHWNTIAFGPEHRKTEITSEVFGEANQRARTFIRVKHDTNWHAWRELYTQASILGPVYQSGGVPTGAIIERGSNANGQFVKYADGTLICWQKTNGGGVNWFDWIYPAGFVSIPVFTATINPSGNSANVFTTQASSSATAASIRKKFMPNAGGAWGDAFGEVVDLLAIGRWY